ncbi:unnamed protein product, partial [Pylaiella littoralis]
KSAKRLDASLETPFKPEPCAQPTAGTTSGGGSARSRTLTEMATVTKTDATSESRGRSSSRLLSSRDEEEAIERHRQSSNDMSTVLKDLEIGRGRRSRGRSCSIGRTSTHGNGGGVARIDDDHERLLPVGPDPTDLPGVFTSVPVPSTIAPLFAATSRETAVAKLKTSPISSWSSSSPSLPLGRAWETPRSFTSSLDSAAASTYNGWQTP